jgi:hypothetical protein
VYPLGQRGGPPQRTAAFEKEYSYASAFGYVAF